MATATIRTGKIKHPPGKSFPSQYDNKPDRKNVAVELDNGGEEKIYFDVGTDYEYLQRGDTVFVSVNHKGRCELTLTPELAKALEERRLSQAPSVAMPSTPSQPPKVTGEMTPEQKRAIAAKVCQSAKLMRFCYEAAKQEFQGLVDDPTELRAIATTLFIQALR